MNRAPLKLAALAVLVLLFCVLLLGPGLLAAPITLLIGWWSSAARLVSNWHPSPAGAVLFVLAATFLILGTHEFFSWVVTHAHRAAGSSNSGPWRWKWTLCGFGVITCALLAICAAVLTTHQIYWLSKSSEPMFSDPFRERVRSLRLGMDFQRRADELQWNAAKTREYFWKSHFLGSMPSAIEAVQPIWIEGDGHSLRAVILVPRHPLNRSDARFTVHQPGTNSTHRLEDLPQVLAAFGAGISPRTPAAISAP